MPLPSAWRAIAKGPVRMGTARINGLPLLHSRRQPAPQPPTLPNCGHRPKITGKKLTIRHLLRKFLRRPPLPLPLTSETAASWPTSPNAKPPPKGGLRDVCDRSERNECEPPVGLWKRIIDFLGSYPMPPNAGGKPDLVLKARRGQGLSQYALGRKLGVIAKTVRLWENGSTEPDRDQLKRLLALAGEAPPSA